MTLRHQFEKEIGIDVCMQLTEEENYRRLWAYIKWLESKRQADKDAVLKAVNGYLCYGFPGKLKEAIKKIYKSGGKG